jgi:ribosomal protein L29
MKNTALLRNKSNEQLKNRLNEIAVSFRRTKGKLTAAKDQASKKGKGENVMYLGNLKEEKARILTILKERDLKL